MLFLILIMLTSSVNAQFMCDHEHEINDDNSCPIKFSKFRMGEEFICCSDPLSCKSLMHFGCGYNKTTNSFTFACTDKEKTDPLRFQGVCPYPRDQVYRRKAVLNEAGVYEECDEGKNHTEYDCLPAYNVVYDAADRSGQDGKARLFYFEKIKKSHLYEVSGGFIYSDQNENVKKDIPFTSILRDQVNVKYDIPEQLHLLPVGYLDNNMSTNCAQNSDCEPVQFCGESLTPNRQKYCYQYPPLHRSVAYQFVNWINPDGVELPVCRHYHDCRKGLYCIDVSAAFPSPNSNFSKFCVAQRKTYERPKSSHELELKLLFTFTGIATLTITIFMAILGWACIGRFVLKNDESFDVLLEEAMPSESEAEMDTENLRTGD